jgi:4-diphosphocytidyl-2-C-methyl-D-erythritol kinase
VFEGWPELESFRDALLEVGATGALLSGSGSTVFGVFEDLAARDDARARLGRQFETWRVTSSSSVDTGIRLSASDP